MDTTHRGKLSRTSINLRFLCASGAALVLSSSFTPASANDFMSEPVAVKDSLSKPPVVDAPMTLRTALNEAPPELVASNGKTAAVLAKKGETAFAAKKYLDAASFFHLAAFAIAHDKSSTQPRIGYLQMESEALFRHGESYPDNVALDKSIERFTSLLGMIVKQKAPRDWAATQSDFGRAMVVSGARFGDHKKIDKGIAAIRAGLEIRRFELSPQDWASLQIDLAEALIAGGRISETNDMLEEAIETCQQVIDRLPVAGLKDAKLEAQSVQGNALQQLGQRRQDATMILNAINVLTDALARTDREKQPQEWARMMNYLANSNREMGELQSDASLMMLAIQQYKQSLETRTRDAMPLAWAQTQLDMGNGLANLAYLQRSLPIIDSAIEAFGKSAEVRSEAETPLEWGMSRNNFAAALATLIDLSNGDAASRLPEKLSANHDALRVTKRENAPLDWAMMQNNLGRTLVAMWNANQLTSYDDYQNSLHAFMQHQKDNPTVTGSPKNEAAGAAILMRFQSIEELEQAVAAYREALKVYTKEARPYNWLQTMDNIAEAYKAMGRKQGKARFFEEVINVNRERQNVLQKNVVPYDWAVLQASIGTSYYEIGWRRKDLDSLASAENAYREAIDVMRKYPPTYSAYMKENLGNLLIFRSKQDNDSERLWEAVTLFEELATISETQGNLSGRDDMKERAKSVLATLKERHSKDTPN